ncbi:hypothetical protein BGW42_007152 [Actinomortierella wolfii]|nr:hypothetical protein BGW42_007152 [Actinomortierella wolfii]
MVGQVPIKVIIFNVASSGSSGLLLHTIKDPAPASAPALVSSSASTAIPPCRKTASAHASVPASSQSITGPFRRKATLPTAPKSSILILSEEEEEEEEEEEALMCCRKRIRKDRALEHVEGNHNGDATELSDKGGSSNDEHEDSDGDDHDDDTNLYNGILT